MPRLLGVLLAFLLWLLVACSSESPSPADREPPPFPGSAGANAWRLEDDPPEGFGPGTAGFASPGSLLEALLSDVVQRDEGLPEGTRLSGGMLEESSDTATAWVYVTGMLDDSVAGAEIRLLMRSAPAGWYIDQLSRRNHCRRGVDLARDLCV